MADMPRRDLIRRSAERARSKPEAMKAKPKSRPGRTSGRWIRTGSVTLTAYSVTKETLAQLIHEMIESRAGEIEEGEHIKCHLQIAEKRRQP